MTNMSPETRKWWKDLAPAYKAMAAVIFFIGVGMAVAAFLLGGQTKANAENIDVNIRAINVNTLRLNTLSGSMDTIKADLTLVRCWVRADIEGTNAASCLVSPR